MTKKKTLVWHYNLLSYWNGGTKFIHTVMSHLREDYRIILVANTTDKKVVKKFEDIGVTVVVNYRWPSNVYVHRLLMPIGIVIDAIKLAKYSVEADYFLATAFPSNVVCALVSKLRKTQYTYYCFEPTVMFFDLQFIKEKRGLERIQWLIASKIYGFIDVWGVKNASNILTLNATTATEIERVYGVSSVQSQVGVDFEFYYHRKKTHFQKQFPGRTIIAHSTDYSPEKQLDRLLKAIALLVSDCPNLLLLVTSTNPDSVNQIKYQKLINQLKIEKNVKFLGFIDYEKIPDLYSSAVCYVSTASGIQYGVTSSNLPVKEAMACGTPAIRAPILHEDVEDGVTGFLVNPDDEKMLAEKINYLLKNPRTRFRMGERAREKVKLSFSWERVATVIKTNLVKVK